MSAPSKPSSEESAATTETGRLGRYQLLQKLASGGMASVYLARAAGPAGFEKVIAVKRIHPHLADEKNFVDMFLDEARIASRIDHANVCSVFDFGEADGTYFIAMEFLAGEPFAQVAKHMGRSAPHLKDPRRPYFVARMIADASEGLHAAHELRSREGELLNVVHRDISPQNLFLTYDGVVKVVDFGIASAADRLHHTQGSEVKGKFSYMAPEQARGTKGSKLDRRADVFALGIVLWEMLALKRLFRRDTPAETLMALVHDPIPTPSSQRPGLTTDFDAITMKALARDPDERYANARELGRDLGKAIGKAGEVMGAVDLAEWLESLVPDAREKSRRQIEAGLQGQIQRNTVPPPGEVSGSDIVVIEHSNVHARPAAVVEAPELDDAATQARSSPILTPPPLRLRPPPPPPRAPAPGVGQVTDRLPAVAPVDARPASSKTVYIGAGLAVLIGAVGVALAVGMGMGLGQRDGAQPPVVAAAPAAGPGGAAAPIALPIVTAPPVAPTIAADPPVNPPDRGSVAARPPVAPPAGSGRPPRTPRGQRGSHVAAGGGGGEAAAPAPTGGLGTLIVSTPGGWANVYDRAGRLLGQTPLRVQLPAGSQALSLRPFGQPPAIAVTVSITAGGTARVNRPLEE